MTARVVKRSPIADARKLRLVAVLDRIIGSGLKLASRPPYDGDSDKSARAYHTLRSEVSLSGETISVRTVVKEDTNGKFHYDITVHAIEAVFDSAKDEGRDESQPSNMTTTNGGGTYPSRFARHQLHSILGNGGRELNTALDSAVAISSPRQAGSHTSQRAKKRLTACASRAHHKSVAETTATWVWRPGLLRRTAAFQAAFLRPSAWSPYGRAVLGDRKVCRFLSTGSPTRHGSAHPFGDGERMN